VTMRLPPLGPPPVVGVHPTRTARQPKMTSWENRRTACTEVEWEAGLRLRMITPRVVSSATISTVKIRAVTLGLDLPVPELVSAPFEAGAAGIRARGQSE